MFRLMMVILLVTLVAFGLNMVIQFGGVVTLEWADYHVEMPTGYMLLIILGTLFALWLLFMVMGWLRRLPHRVDHSVHQHRQQRIQNALEQALLGIAEQDGKALTQAAKSLRHALPKTSLLPKLVHYESHRVSGEVEKADEAARELLKEERTRFIGLRHVMEKAQAEGNHPAALQFARELQKVRPDLPDTTQSLLTELKYTGRYEEAASVLEELQQQRFLPAKKSIREKEHHEQGVLLLMRSREAMVQGHQEEAMHYAEEAYRHQPSFEPVAQHFAALLAQAGTMRRATSVLERLWKERPNDLIAQQYLTVIPAETVKKRLRRAKKLLTLQPEHPAALRAVATAALEVDDTMQAREMLERALQKESHPASYQLMARLLEAEGESQDEILSWKEKARDSLAPSWRCGACGHEAREWHFVCPSCQVLDRMALRQENAAGALIHKA
ncbi:MAG: hypothetical protein H6908_01590 [Hyphomicrobiales bacterium]|nr:hypothetical protein [Rickettsiales bacterium]MCP5361326.1 hypothetical protein [Hyphomicrobiales bacterium]